jgi:hypothetical protein
LRFSSGDQLHPPLGRQKKSEGNVPWISKKAVSSMGSKSSIRLRDSCQFIFPSLCLPFWEIERSFPFCFFITYRYLLYTIRKVVLFRIFASLRSNTSTGNPLKIPPGYILRTCSPQSLLPGHGDGAARMKWRVFFKVSCILFNQHINIVWQGMQDICCGIGWRDHANARAVRDSLWLFPVQQNSTYIRTERFVFF